MDKAVESELVKLASSAGKNHLNSKINELIDLHGEIITRKVISQDKILKLITDRVSMYQIVVKDRYL